MKYFFAVIWTLICVSVLLYGHVHWNKQTAVKAVDTTHASEQASETVPDVEKVSNSDDIDKYIKLAANLPESAKEQLKRSLKENQPYKILFVGSSEIQWEKEVSQRIIEEYGSERITTALHSYDMTSNDFIDENKQQEIVAEKAQLVVIEPFLLNDNGSVTIDETLGNITKVLEDVKAANPDTTFILQPSYPIYLPKYYSDQVEALKEYAMESNLTYLDHWTAWPATDNVEINDYLIDVQSGPNDKGYNVWANFLVEYFVKK